MVYLPQRFQLPIGTQGSLPLGFTGWLPLATFVATGSSRYRGEMPSIPCDSSPLGRHLHLGDGRSQIPREDGQQLRRRGNAPRPVVIP